MHRLGRDRGLWGDLHILRLLLIDRLRSDRLLIDRLDSHRLLIDRLRSDGLLIDRLDSHRLLIDRLDSHRLDNLCGNRLLDELWSDGLMHGVSHFLLGRDCDRAEEWEGNPDCIEHKPNARPANRDILHGGRGAELRRLGGHRELWRSRLSGRWHIDHNGLLRNLNVDWRRLANLHYTWRGSDFGHHWGRTGCLDNRGGRCLRGGRRAGVRRAVDWGR